MSSEQKRHLIVERRLGDLLKPGEVFVSNGFREPIRDESGKTEVRSGFQEAASLSRSKNWKSVRVLDRAFTAVGKPLPGFVALVGTSSR